MQQKLSNKKNWKILEIKGDLLEESLEGLHLIIKDKTEV
jgi:hypothetical protein